VGEAVKICPCGIAAEDCTYHAPAPDTQRAPYDGADWAVPLSVYDPAGAALGAGVSTPHLNPGPNVFHAPPWVVAPSWKPTPCADGTHVDDRLCKCRSYCIKHRTVYIDDQTCAHSELICP